MFSRPADLLRAPPPSAARGRRGTAGREETMPRNLDRGRIALAALAKGDQVRHWMGKTDAVRAALADGWSTFWVSKELGVPPAEVRKIRRGAS
jgi:hypothetical protein